MVVEFWEIRRKPVGMSKRLRISLRAGFRRHAPEKIAVGILTQNELAGKNGDAGDGEDLHVCPE
jgi:hypothetical protein